MSFDSLLSKPLDPPVPANRLLAPKISFLPVLSNVKFSQGNWLVGYVCLRRVDRSIKADLEFSSLDDCEDRQARDKAELVFRGDLTVNKMEMLSKDGRELLQSMLTEKSSSCNLKTLISTQRFKVQVQGVVQGIPAYKTRGHVFTSQNRCANPCFAGDDTFQLDCKDEYVESPYALSSD